MGVPVRVFDDAGTLLLVTEAAPSSGAGPERGEDDAPRGFPAGRELPRSGPTALPTLARLPEPIAPAAPPAGDPVRVEDPVPVAPEPDDVPSGSALASVDMDFGAPPPLHAPGRHRKVPGGRGRSWTG